MLKASPNRVNSKLGHIWVVEYAQNSCNDNKRYNWCLACVESSEASVLDDHLVKIKGSEDIKA